MSKKLTKINKTIDGFTLVELIISLAIIAVISSLVFFNGRTFNDKLIVSSAAEEASLAIREAQSYGVSVKESAVGSGQFNYSYGIIFGKDNPSNAFIFVDKNANGLYDGDTACTPGLECVEKIFLRNGATITSVCAVNTLGVTVCQGDWRSVQATFIRPNLDATITVINNAGGVVLGPWLGGKIVITSPLGVSKTVSISTTGQISIQ